MMGSTMEPFEPRCVSCRRKAELKTDLIRGKRYDWCGSRECILELRADPVGPFRLVFVLAIGCALLLALGWWVQ